MGIRGSVIERRASEDARKEGWLTFKMDTRSNIGAPDRMYLKKGICFFVEFKGKEEPVKPMQKYYRLRILGENVPSFICRSMGEWRSIKEVMEKVVTREKDRPSYLPDESNQLHKEE